MKRFFLFFSLVFFIILGCGNGDENLRRYGFVYFRVTIEQDGLVKEVVDNKVTLSKNPFTITVRFIGKERIFVNACFDETTFDLASEGKSHSEIAGFKGSEIAEEPLNKDEVLYVSDKSPNYWYFNNESDHRFSKC